MANPFAKELHFADHATRTRRDHMKYLTLIRTIALVHQHQRPVRELEHGGAKVRYVEVTRQDIATADHLCAQVLSRSLDELAPQTRRLLGLVDGLVNKLARERGIERADVRFSRRDVREHTGWGHTQLKVHLGRLEDLEYLHMHAGGARKRIVYELMYDANWSGAGRPVVGGAERPDLSSDCSDKHELVGAAAPAHQRIAVNGRSQRSATSALVAESGPAAIAAPTTAA